MCERARAGAVGRGRCRAADRPGGCRPGARGGGGAVRSPARDGASRSRSRSAPSLTGWSAKQRSSSARRSATCSRGFDCLPIRPTRARWCARSRGPPIDLRSVDIARCTQIARRRKLDMVAALAAALESPQVPPEARDRIVAFLKLYRSGVAAIDTTRPDLYVHRLIDRLGLRRQQLFAAQAEVVEQAARAGPLRRARGESTCGGSRRQRHGNLCARSRPSPSSARASRRSRRCRRSRRVQIVGLDGAGGVRGRARLRAGAARGLAAARLARRFPTRCCTRMLPRRDEPRRGSRLRQALYTALTRARRGGAVLSGVRRARSGSGALPSWRRQAGALGAAWEDKQEELFGPAETLHSTYRLLRDELLEGTMRVGGRLGELRLDTDLDVSHAVVRYLELLKLAALIERPEEQGIGRRAPRRQLADPPGGHRRAARDLQLLGTRRLPARRRA